MNVHEMQECLTQIKNFEIERMKEDNCDPHFINGVSFGMTFMINRMFEYLKGDKELLIETYDIKLNK